MAGIVLQHEAYRDGLTGADQVAETFAAVTGHTEMALRIRDDGLYVNVITNNANLTRDIENYEAGNESFSAYATSYDSSGDYWKVMSDGSIVFDGNKDLVDEYGNILKEYDGNGGYTDSLADLLGICRKEADSMLRSAGLTYEDGTFTTSTGIDAKNNDAIRIQAPDFVAQRLIVRYGNQVVNVREQYYASVVEGYCEERKREEWQNLDDTSVLWANLASTDGEVVYMQDFGRNVELGNSGSYLHTDGCHLIASIRSLLGLGRDVDVLSSAANNAYFNEAGELQGSFFNDNDIHIVKVEGLEAINNALTELQTFDQPYALIGAAKFGNGYHSVNISQVYITPGGQYEVLAHETSRTGVLQGRRYGLSNNKNNRQDYFQIEDLYYLF